MGELVMSAPSCWSDVLICPDAPREWLWHGFLAPGKATLLTSYPFAGKRTLLSILLAHRNSGAPLLDRLVTPGKTVIATELDAFAWRRRIEKLSLGRSVCFLFNPFAGPATAAMYDELVATLLNLRRMHGIDLAVLDPLQLFLPGCGESTDPFHANALLRPLLAAGFATLLLDRPGFAKPGRQLPAGLADIELELRPLAGGSSRTRGCRELLAHTGYRETPAVVQFSMNREWTDAHVLPQRTPQLLPRHWSTLQQLLAQASRKLTRAEIHRLWPEESSRPNIATLWRWLETACAFGQLSREGAGHWADPFRYGLAEGT
jgi:hypothetical protein